MPATSTGEWRPWEPGDPVRVLAYAKSKEGKTFGAGTFPRPCIFDFDRGISTLYNTDFMRKHGYIDFKQFGYKAFWERSFQGPIVKAHNAYDDACKHFDAMMLPQNRNKFDSFVIDSATTMGEDAQNKGIILLGTTEFSNMSGTHAQALKSNMLIPKIQDYMAERSLVEQFIDMVLSTDKHVVVLCHEKEQRDKKGELIGIGPLLTGKSDEAVALRFDEVYNIQARKAGADYDKTTNTTITKWTRVCITQPDGLRKVGSRNSVPDGTLWEYDTILAALTANYEERERIKAESMKKTPAAQTAAEQSGRAVGSAIPAGPQRS